MFFLMILLLAAGVHCYVAWCATRALRAVFPRYRSWVSLAVAGVMTLVTLLGLTSVPVFDVLGAYWMGFLIYLFLMLLLAELVLAVVRLVRRKAPQNRAKMRFWAGTVSVLLAFAIALGGFINARIARIVPYEVDLSDGTPEGTLRVVMISDLHLGSVGSESRLASLVADINAELPDLVVVAGDFFDSDFDKIDDPEGAAALLRSICSTYGVFACFGNHDAGDTYEKMKNYLSSCHVTLLSDEYAVVDEQILLVGRRDPSPIGRAGGKRAELTEILSGAPADLPVIVLDHNPASVDTYGAEADLLLCGHTHKGQLFPGSLITDAMYTVDHGYYRRDGESPHVIVSSGFGTWGPPIRVGTASEIVVVDVKI